MFFLIILKKVLSKIVFFLIKKNTQSVEQLFLS